MANARSGSVIQDPKSESLGGKIEEVYSQYCRASQRCINSLNSISDFVNQKAKSVSNDYDERSTLQSPGNQRVLQQLLHSLSGSGRSVFSIHPGVICDECDGEVRGIRYKCVLCPDFDLCQACEDRGRHNQHPMYKIPKPLEKIYPGEKRMRIPAAVEHDGITCDNCNNILIKGLRYKCMVCDDYDLCQDCACNDFHGMHPMYLIPEPLETRWLGR